MRAAERGEAAFDGGEVASATECTGLMPALPRDEAEDAAQAALYAIHRARRRPDEARGQGVFPKL